MALTNGASEIWINPSNGRLSSRIRKIAPDTDSAANISATTTVPFDGENRPKLTKRMASQKVKSDEQRDGHRGVCLLEFQPAHLAELHGRGQGLRFQRGLQFVLRRQLLDRGIHRLRPGRAGIQLGMFAKSCPATCDRAMRSTDRRNSSRVSLRLRSIIGQQPVEEDDFGRHLGHAARFFVVRILRRRDEQSENQGRHRRDKSHGELHRILRFGAEVVLGKHGAEQHSDQSGAEDAREHDECYDGGTQDRILRRVILTTPNAEYDVDHLLRMPLPRQRTTLARRPG